MSKLRDFYCSQAHLQQQDNGKTAEEKKPFSLTVPPVLTDETPGPAHLNGKTRIEVDRSLLPSHGAPSATPLQQGLHSDPLNHLRDLFSELRGKLKPLSRIRAAEIQPLMARIESELEHLRQSSFGQSENGPSKSTL